MQYILLIYDNEADWKNAAPGDQAAMVKEYGEFTQGIVKSGHSQMRPGDALRLQPTSTATTVRVRAGKTLRTDGPFAETREQLGGYYVIEAANLDEAIEIAARIPSARGGSIEVRPLMVYPKPGA